MTTIRQIIEAWAQWRHTRFWIPLGYGKTPLARMMDGMPGTNCPLCRTTGKYGGNTCPQCSGLGRIKLDPSSTRLKINPAGIRSTGQPEDNPIFYTLDAIIAQQLSAKRKRIIKAEYVWWPSETQKERARRLGISHGHFRDLLYETHGEIEQRLKNDRSSAG